MNISLMKLSLACLLLGLVSTAQAANYFDKAENCLNVADIKAVDSHFEQFQNFSNTSKTQVCRGDMDEKWFEVVRSTLALQRLNVTDVLQRDANDDMTLRPIGQKDWWTYYTQRANQYVIEPSRCNGNPNVVAFVYPFFRGSINLCPRFFEMDSASQIEVLMHEVRHFDGHSHVTCTQGNEEGNAGACDRQIKQGGSYAVSVQANVELSYVDQLNFADRVLAESSAIYSVNNKFNSLPTVKATDYVYASNDKAEVWRLPKGKPSQAEFVTALDDAAAIYGNGSQFTVYPVDTTKDAYRISKGFKTLATAIGAYANMYNADNATERKAYGAISYYGMGSIVKDNNLHTFCGTQATSMTSFAFNSGNIKALPVLKDSEGADKMFIMNDAGDLYEFNCNDNSGRLSTAQTRSVLPAETATAFAFNANDAVVLTDAGELKAYNLKTNSYEGIISGETNWISASPLKVYNVFDNDLK